MVLIGLEGVVCETFEVAAEIEMGNPRGGWERLLGAERLVVHGEIHGGGAAGKCGRDEEEEEERPPDSWPEDSKFRGV